MYGAGKTPSQIVEIVAALQGGESARPTLVTRAGPGAVGRCVARWPHATVEGTTVVVGTLPSPRGRVAILSAGTSDPPLLPRRP